MTEPAKPCLAFTTVSSILVMVGDAISTNANALDGAAQPEKPLHLRDLCMNCPEYDTGKDFTKTISHNTNNKLRCNVLCNL